MRLVILEVLLNPLLWGWGHSGDLTANFAPVVGSLTPRFVKSPVMKLTSALRDCCKVTVLLGYLDLDLL